VTPPLGSRATERDPLGKLGSRIVRLQMRSSILLITHITTWTRRTPTLSCLSGLLWFCMARQAMETPLRNVQQYNKNRTLENIPHTQVKCKNPISLVFSTRTITDMKI